MKKRILSLLSCLLVMALLCANLPVGFAAAADRRIVDAATLDQYTSLFYDNNKIDTYSAGAVWTDKSVMKDSAALGLPIPMQNAEENFLIALSAIASNKEIIGYSSIPTDTMIILDASSSMETEDLKDMVTATNAAIANLYKVSNHNRIGIVIYNRDAKVLMPIDRYTPANGSFLTFSENGNTISITNGVKNSLGQSVSGSDSEGTGTYTQGGIYTALQEFLKADTTIQSGQIQGGTARMPIFLLMTDGAATFSSSNYTNATNSAVDSGSWAQENDRNTFLTMLTAAYAKAQVAAHYNRNALFYTLGYGNVLSNADAVSSLDTENMTAAFAGYCDAYNKASVGDTVTLYRGATVTKRVSGTNLNYVDAYFAAQSGLEQAFGDIVNEIIIQSRYYATHVSGTDPDFDGYLYFEDKLGKYMEVKELKGIKHGQDYFTGAALASHLSETDLGTIQNPTAFGIAFRDSVKARLNIAHNADAFALIEQAYNAGQLRYSSRTDYSNYIGWYSDASGAYLGFWNEGVTSDPATATHKNKSYGFYGKINENTVAESDMMFMSIMIRTEIATGDQTVMWRIPASLMPMLTYKVELNGSTIAGSTVKSLTVENRESIAPVRLLYEVGINDTVINPLNVEQLGTVKDANGNYQFWTNYFDKSAPEHEDHIAAFSEFNPNVHNERYFYAEDTPIYVKSGETYQPVTDRNHHFDTSAENLYYHIRYSFREGEDRAIAHYEPISTVSLGETMRKYENGQWYIKQGTVYRIIYPTSIIHKQQNATESILFSHKPFITLENGIPKATVKLGNNGLTTMTPATGFKISKTMAPGVISDQPFTFTVKLTPAPNQSLANAYSYILADLDALSGRSGSANVAADGTMTVTLSPNQTLYFTDIPAGTAFAATEQDLVEYRPSSVTVDGVAVSGLTAQGTVTEHHLTDVDFINRLKGTSGLSITKTVEHPYGNGYAIPNILTFPVTVTLTDANNTPYANQTLTSGGTTDANGQISFEIAHGQTVMLTGIHEDIRYRITEQNREGFTLNQNKSTALSGVITADTLAVEHLVNTYSPRPATLGASSLIVEKDLSGRDWLTTDAFQFQLAQKSPNSPTAYQTVGSAVATSENKKVTFDLSSHTFTAIGTYRYVLSESAPDVTNGITYDQTERLFTVTVGDPDMSGRLIIEKVENVQGTTVTKTNSGYLVTATPFTNVYAVSQGAVATVTVDKKMDLQNGLDHALDGFLFRLTDVSGNTIDSAPTDKQGHTQFSISYAPENVGKTFTYTLTEVNTGIKNMTYDQTEYTVTVKILDNFNGTSRSEVTVTKGNEPIIGDATFTNRYTPAAIDLPLTVVKTMNPKGLPHSLDGFKFLLKGEDWEETLVSDTGGKAFYTLSFDKDDIGKTFSYTLTEVNTGIENMAYDTKTVNVSVTVTLENGELTATVLQDETAVNEISAEFVNTYTEKEPTPSTGDLRMPLYAALFIASAGLALSLIYYRKTSV